MTWSYLLVILPSLLIAACVGWLVLARTRAERALAEQGVRGRATVTGVRDDRSDMQTIISYEFNHGGKAFQRTGVLDRAQPLPREGSMIDIIFVPGNAGISRLALEEGRSR